MTTPRTPSPEPIPHLFTSWAEIELKLRKARHIAVFTDFDGTLVGIRPNPGEVEMGKTVRKILLRLAHEREPGVVGVISGRRLDDVNARVGAPRIWYAGEHGFYLRDPQSRVIPLVRPIHRERMERLHDAIRQRVVGLRGIRVEYKGVTIAVHYRHASNRVRDHARRALNRILAREEHVRLLPGKKVWDLLPAEKVDKWVAIGRIMRRVKRRIRGGPWLLIFLGDDATDEAVFRCMKRGISVAVGKSVNTSAKFYLDSPGEVCEFLDRLSRYLPRVVRERRRNGNGKLRAA